MKIFKSFSFFLIVLSLCIFSECVKKQNIESHEQPIVITIGSQPNSDMTFSQLVDTVIFIPLETTSIASIGLISKILVTDSCIFTMDGFIEQCIYCFDLSGKFKFKIDQVGKGPGEYASLSDFCITPDNQIVVSEKSGKKILFYDNQGKFKKEFTVDFYPSGIAYLDKNLFALSSLGLETKIKIISGDGDFYKSMFEVDPNFISTYHDVLTLAPRMVLFREVYGDTIFQISKEMITPAYFIDFQDQRLTKAKYLTFPISNKNDLLERQFPPGYRYGSSQLFVTQNFVTFSFIHTTPPRGSYLSFFDRNTGKSIFMKGNNGFDDLLGTPSLPRIMGVWNEKFIIPMDSYLFMDCYDKAIQLFGQNKPGYQAQLELVKNMISFESNPILVIFSLNELN